MSCPAVRYSRGYPVILFCGILKDLYQSIKKVMWTFRVTYLIFAQLLLTAFIAWNFRLPLFCILKRKWMFLWNLMCMTYLLESQGSDLFRPFIVKTPGSGTPCLKSNNIEIVVNIPILREFCWPVGCPWCSDLHERVDFVACLGGDGVILHASNLFRGAVPPLVSFNPGSFGFLTSHTVSFLT